MVVYHVFSALFSWMFLCIGRKSRAASRGDTGDNDNRVGGGASVANGVGGGASIADGITGGAPTAGANGTISHFCRWPSTPMRDYHMSSAAWAIQALQDKHNKDNNDSGGGGSSVADGVIGGAPTAGANGEHMTLVLFVSSASTVFVALSLNGRIPCFLHPLFLYCSFVWAANAGQPDVVTQETTTMAEAAVHPLPTAS